MRQRYYDQDLHHPWKVYVAVRAHTDSMTTLLSWSVLRCRIACDVLSSPRTLSLWLYLPVVTVLGPNRLFRTRNLP